MCGISGIINLNGEKIDLGAVIRMNNSLIHRGPDSEGYLLCCDTGSRARFFRSKQELMNNSSDYDKQNICIAHRRLSIIDIENGAQPMANEDGTVWVVFNGQIYNYKEIWQDLESKGHIFKTDHSDTEVIVHAWEEWGRDCLKKFNGMFAFVILDLRRDVLFLARDRVGIKPLYFYRDDNRFIFASELKSIVRSGLAGRELDPSAVADYFRYGYVPSPKAIVKNVSKLKPAHYVFSSLRKDKFTVEQTPYWDLSFNPDYSIKEEEWIRLLEDRISQAVRIQMVSDVPIGLLLSGGIDSSIVALCMHKATRKAVKTFSIGFRESKFDETLYARKVAAKFHTDHYEEVLTRESLDSFGKLVSFYDEPFADSSAIPMYYISKLARKHVVVALSGDGGDEGFAGYERYSKAIHYKSTIDLFPSRLRNIFFKPADKLMPDHIKGKGFIKRMILGPMARYDYIMTQFDGTGLFTFDFCKSIGAGYRNRLLDSYWHKQKNRDYLTLMQYVDTKTYLPDDILVKVDRASMAVSLEVRVPLLDHNILELAAKMPAEMKMRGSIKKFALKKILSKSFDSDFINRKKMGFAVPVADWFKGDWAGFVKETVLKDNDIFNKKYLTDLLSSHGRGLRNLGGRIYAVLFFKLWRQALNAS